MKWTRKGDLTMGAAIKTGTANRKGPEREGGHGITGELKNP